MSSSMVDGTSVEPQRLRGDGPLEEQLRRKLHVLLRPSRAILYLCGE